MRPGPACRGAALALALASAAPSCRGSARHPASAPTIEARSVPEPAPAAAVTASAPLPDDLRPDPEAGELTRGAEHLIEAIAADDARLASDILFPRNAWMALRDCPDPALDWDRRVAAPFRKAIHRLSRRGAMFDSARFVSMQLGSDVKREAPRPRAWKAALWIVRGSHVTFVVDGRTRSLFIREMVSWRGHYYVTRLR